MVGNAALIRCKINKLSDKQKPSDVLIAQFGKQTVIGRDPTSDFRIDSIEVSRRHAILETKDNNWFVSDLESTNGVFLNDTQLDPYSPHCIKNGDKLSLGPSNRSQFIYKFVCNEIPKRPIKSSKRKECPQTTELDPKRMRSEFEELFDSELSCSICQELFVSPINLNCSHTFCLSCIEEWKRSNDVRNKRKDALNTLADTNCCPICRQPIVSQNRVLALDNVINYLVAKWTPELSEHRKQLIDERKRLIPL